MDILWENKINKVVYRGSPNTNKNRARDHKFIAKELWLNYSNGYHKTLTYNMYLRKIFVEQYYNTNKSSLFDIGFGFEKSLFNYKKNKKRYMKKYEKAALSIKEQLKYKYIIAMEGNDVSSALKWILYSNSCVFMPFPDIESWLMEGLLIPYFHFIPLQYDTFTNKFDLNDKYLWCLQNDNKCKQIALNGKELIQKFLNNENELYIKQQIIKRYCTNFEFVL
eukprot:451117_1